MNQCISPRLVTPLVVMGWRRRGSLHVYKPEVWNIKVPEFLLTIHSYSVFNLHQTFVSSANIIMLFFIQVGNSFTNRQLMTASLVRLVTTCWGVGSLGLFWVNRLSGFLFASLKSRFIYYRNFRGNAADCVQCVVFEYMFGSLWGKK